MSIAGKTVRRARTAVRRVHYVLSTHWDREWYETQQQFRFRLVRVMDRVLDALQEGQLAGPFVADGQTILLEDYLEVRPERRELVERLMARRQLIAGPWYVLPDEFLVSGESLIRNISYGRAMVRRLGGSPSNVGCLVDLFGHNSQMPQILRGFGIRVAFLWRGVNLEGKRHLVWEGADGSSVVAYCHSYANYAVKVRRVMDHSPQASAESRQAEVDAYLQREASVSEVDPVLVFDGADHQEWDEEMYEAIRARLAEPLEGMQVLHSDLDKYFKEVRQQAERITPLRRGELRELGKLPLEKGTQWLLSGVLSSRVPLKQQNARCERLLYRFAEPMSVLADVSGTQDYPIRMLELSWKLLLQNHPHDSICGCSIDAVHSEMGYRFAQSSQIAQKLVDEACQSIALSVTDAFEADELQLTVFNASARPHSGVAELEIPLPPDWPTYMEYFGYEAKPAFELYDSAGNNLPYQLLEQLPPSKTFRAPVHKFPKDRYVRAVRVAMHLDVPAIGYTTLRVKRAATSANSRLAGHLAGARDVENDHLKITAMCDGTLELLDKQSGQVYQRLFELENTADIGDGWFFCPPVNNQTVLSAGPASITILAAGPELSRLRVCHTFHVPQRFDFTHQRRSRRTASLKVEMVITLRRDSRAADIDVILDNRASDHRTRFLLPTNTQAATYLSDSPFDVIERTIAMPPDRTAYRELPTEGQPQQSWTAVHDASRGLAVVAPGLYESAVLDRTDRAIALTLVRSTRRTVHTSGEPGGQVRGRLRYKLALMPLSGAPDYNAIFDLANATAGNLHTVCLDAQDRTARTSAGPLPLESGLINVGSEAQLTSVQRVNGRLQLRLFNPEERRVEVALRLGPALAARVDEALLVDLEGRPAGSSLEVTDGELRLAMTPKQIATVRLVEKSRG